MEIGGLLLGHSTHITGAFACPVDLDGHPLATLIEIGAHVVDHVVELGSVSYHTKVAQFTLVGIVGDYRLAQVGKDQIQRRVCHSCSPGIVRPDARKSSALKKSCPVIRLTNPQVRLTKMKRTVPRRLLLQFCCHCRRPTLPS